MKKKALPEIMLLLILTSTTWFAAFNPVTGGASSAGGSPAYGESDSWWRMFHHDSTHTGYSNSTMPNQLCQFWNTSGMIKGSVKSSPAVVDNKVFVGSSDKKVYALNAINGTHVWNYTTEGAVLSSPAVTSDRVFVGSDDGYLYALNATKISSQCLIWRFPTGGKIASSPAVAHGMVFFGSYDGYVYALNATSQNATEIWKFRTAYPVCSSPAVSGNRVFVGTSDGRVYALNVTGRYEWHFSAGSNCSSSPAVAGGMVFVGSDNGNVYALNETNGNEIWSYRTGGAVKSSPAVADGIVFVGSDDHYLYALNATTKSPSGDLKWRRPTGGKIASSPAIADNKVFVGSSDNRTYAFNTTDGSPIWNVTLAGSICSSPAITKIDKYDMLFIGCDDMKVYAFGPENEVPRPIISYPPQQSFILQNVTFDASASYDPDSDILNCTWNFGDGIISKYPSWQNGKTIYHKYGTARLYNVTLSVTDYHPIQRLRKTNMTYCLVMVNDAWPTYRHDISHTGRSTSFGPVTNQTLWNLTINSSPSSDGLMCSSPAVIYGVAYIGSTNGTVFAVNVIDGSVMWRRNLGGALHSSPAVADGLVFIGSDDKKVYALNASTGAMKWSCETLGLVYSSPAVWDGLVYVASQEGKIYALKEFAEPGNYTYNDPRIRKWEFPAYYSYVHSSPAVADGLVFIGYEDKRVSALNAAKGGQNWSYQTGGAVKSSPAVADGIVFVGSDDGYLYALNATTKPMSPPQRLKWRFLTGGKIASSPTVADGIVFVGSDDGYLYALNATAKPLTDSQRLKWKEKIGSVDSVGYSSPVVADCKVFLGSKDGKIYAFHKESGESVWSYGIGGSIRSSPVISSDTLYVASGGSLYAFSGQVHDVAIKGVTATPSRIPQGGTVTISLVAENEGSFNETGINVTIYYSNATYMEVANRTVISDLYRHDKTTVALPWNTGNVAVGTYKINATITPATDDDPADNNREGGNVTVGGWYDMSIQDAWVGYNVTNATCRLKRIVCQGYNATIYVTVRNGGGMEGADINVIAYWSNSSRFNETIGSCVIPYLLIGDSKTVTIYWNTNATGVPLSKGNYTIRAYVVPVPGENDTANNNFSDGWAKVSMVGDVTSETSLPDGKVDLRDVFAVGRAYGSVPCQDKWNPNYDINNDGTVDLKDIMIVNRNYGKVDP